MLEHKSSSHRATLCLLSTAHKGPCCAGVYSSTVLLPSTNFNIRGMSKVKEPEIQQFWADNNIYEELSTNSPGEVRTASATLLQAIS